MYQTRIFINKVLAIESIGSLFDLVDLAKTAEQSWGGDWSTDQTSWAPRFADDWGAHQSWGCDASAKKSWGAPSVGDDSRVEQGWGTPGFTDDWGAQESWCTPSVGDHRGTDQWGAKKSWGAPGLSDDWRAKESWCTPSTADHGRTDQWGTEQSWCTNAGGHHRAGQWNACWDCGRSGDQGSEDDLQWRIPKIRKIFADLSR